MLKNNRGRKVLSIIFNLLPRLTLFIAGVIVGLMLVRLYHLTARNLILENFILENEINDYVANKLEMNNE